MTATLTSPAGGPGQRALLGMEIVASSPAEFRKDISSEIARWAKVVKDANIKVD